MFIVDMVIIQILEIVSLVINCIVSVIELNFIKLN